MKNKAPRNLFLPITTKNYSKSPFDGNGSILDLSFFCKIKNNFYSINPTASLH